MYYKECQIFGVVMAKKKTWKNKEIQRIESKWIANCDRRHKPSFLWDQGSLAFRSDRRHPENNMNKINQRQHCSNILIHVTL